MVYLLSVWSTAIKEAIADQAAVIVVSSETKQVVACSAEEVRDQRSEKWKAMRNMGVSAVSLYHRPYAHTLIVIPSGFGIRSSVVQYNAQLVCRDQILRTWAPLLLGPDFNELIRWYFKSTRSQGYYDVSATIGVHPTLRFMARLRRRGNAVR